MVLRTMVFTIGITALVAVVSGHTQPHLTAQRAALRPDPALREASCHWVGDTWVCTTVPPTVPADTVAGGTVSGARVNAT